MRRTQKQRNEDTRRALLDAGAALLREVGYARTSVAQITQRANRAHGTFYLHFENKREMVSVLLEDMIEETRRHTVEIWRTEPRVDAMWLGVRDFLARSTPERSLWWLLDEMVAVEEDAAPLRSKLRHLYVEPMLRSIRERPDGVNSSEPNLELVANLLASMGLYFARTGNLPASPDLTALHLTVVWCHAVGQPITETDLANLRAMFEVDHGSKELHGARRAGK